MVWVSTLTETSRILSATSSLPAPCILVFLTLFLDVVVITFSLLGRSRTPRSGTFPTPLGIWRSSPLCTSPSYPNRSLPPTQKKLLNRTIDGNSLMATTLPSTLTNMTYLTQLFAASILTVNSQEIIFIFCGRILRNNSLLGSFPGSVLGMPTTMYCFAIVLFFRASMLSILP